MCGINKDIEKLLDNCFADDVSLEIKKVIFKDKNGIDIEELRSALNENITKLNRNNLIELQAEKEVMESRKSTCLAYFGVTIGILAAAIGVCAYEKNWARAVLLFLFIALLTFIVPIIFIKYTDVYILSLLIQLLEEALNKECYKITIKEIMEE